MGKAGLSSMTAFASSEGAADGLTWSWDLRSVNGRGLDLRLRLPEGLAALEQPLRGVLQKALTRLTDTDLQLRSAGQTAPAMAIMERTLIWLAMRIRPR